jgi:hypothetical protein
MMNLKTTNPYHTLLQFSEAQARYLFISNDLSLTPTNLTTGTYWLYQRGDRVGEVMEIVGQWFTNNRILFDAPFPNYYLASLAELISRPISCVPTQRFAQAFIDLRGEN